MQKNDVTEQKKQAEEIETTIGAIDNKVRLFSQNLAKLQTETTKRFE